MARIRTIKPEFIESESVGRLSRDARLLFIQLWLFVDDSGRARASSRLLASRLYPYDEEAPDLIDGWLDELVAAGHVRLYEVDGDAYLDIPKWLKHQKIDRPTPSRIPEFREEFSKPREGSRALDAHTLDLGPVPRTMDQHEAAPASPNGAGAPRAPRLETVEPGSDDVKAAIFGAGLAWLIRRTGANESSCRSFLGSLIGQHGEIATATALLAAERAKPVDPRSWLKRNIGATNGQRPRNRSTQGEHGLSPELAGISAALARRPVQPG